MKRKKLLLLSFLLSQSASVYAMEPLSDEPRIVCAPSRNAQEQSQALDKVHKIQRSIQEVIRVTETNAAQYEDLKKVIIIGPSGSGKSTLLNVLAGKELVADSEGNLDTESPISGSEIGHDIHSKTTIPSLWKHPDDIIFWDCPGFNESRGEG